MKNTLLLAIAALTLNTAFATDYPTVTVNEVEYHLADLTDDISDTADGYCFLQGFTEGANEWEAESPSEVFPMVLLDDEGGISEIITSDPDEEYDLITNIVCDEENA